jgi:HK97 family phage prohead protease
MNGTDVDFKTLIHGRMSKQQKSAGPVTKQFPVLLDIKSVDLKNRRIVALASTGSVDRYDEIILPEAFREGLQEYVSQNNIVLCSHQHKLETGHSTVVANVIEARITTVGLEVVIEFHDITELAEEYWQLYSQKKQRALSVGFSPKEGGYEEREGKRIYVHTKVELFEISVCVVGANRDALSRAKQKKLSWLDEKKEQAGMDELERELLEIDPDFNKKDFDENGMELAELWLGDDHETGGEYLGDETDYVGIVKGTACGEFARIVKGNS